MTGDCHVRFCENLGLRCPGLLDDFNGLNQVIINRGFIFFLFVILVVSIGQSSISFYFTIYMRHLGATPVTTGTAIGVQALSELPFFFIAIWLLKKWSPGKIVFISIVATALRLYLYSITHIPYSVIFIELFNGITWTLLWIAAVEYVDSIIPLKWRTTGQSLLWASYYGAGSILGTIISGRLYQVMSMHNVYFINSLVMVLLIMISGYFLITHKRIAVK